MNSLIAAWQPFPYVFLAIWSKSTYMTTRFVSQYMLDGEFIHEDSKGHRGQLQAGGVSTYVSSCF